MSRQLLMELRDTEVESVSLVNSENLPLGAKSTEIVTIGALSVAVLPTLLPKIIDAIQAWALRGQGKTVKFKGKINGQAIEFEGSAEELEKIIGKFYKNKKK